MVAIADIKDFASIGGRHAVGESGEDRRGS